MLAAADASITVKHPAARIICETNMFIVGIRRRGCDENQFAPWAELVLRDDLQLLANPALLAGLANSEIGQIARIVEIGH